MNCSNCGEEKKRAGKFCSKCYAQNYRRTEKGKKAVIAAANKWNSKNPEKRAEYVKNYRGRTGYYTPEELKQLNYANKRLEKALAGASQRN